MLNWTKEDVEFIINNILTPCITPCFEKIAEENMKLDEITTEANQKIFMMLAERIRELDYEKMRDRAFFLSYLSKLDRLYDVNKIYKEFCEEYDKHNKHLLNEGDANA
jgi:hypothetical protein